MLTFFVVIKNKGTLSFYVTVNLVLCYVRIVNLKN